MPPQKAHTEAVNYARWERHAVHALAVPRKKVPLQFLFEIKR